MSGEEALEELRRGAGTQFDPDLVRRFADKVVPALDQGSQMGAVTSPG
jgi:HD-GYP domain-containing protein (c-di-GMP phosphodiesterase class II)